MSALTVGLKYQQSITVTDALTVPAMAGSFQSFSQMPPVLATAYMVAFTEWACTEALAPFLTPEQRTVGTHIDMSHIAATPVGMMITASVELVAIDGRKLRFKVACHDEADVIGSGSHERAIIDVEKFMQRLSGKSAGRPYT